MKNLLLLLMIFAVCVAEAQNRNRIRPRMRNTAARQQAQQQSATADNAGQSAAGQPSAGSGDGEAFASAAVEEEDETLTSDLNFRNAELDQILLTYGRLVERTVLKDPQTPALTLTFQSRRGQKLSKEQQIEAIEVLLEMNGIHFENYGENFVRAIPRKTARKEGIPLYLDANDPEILKMPEGRVLSVNLEFKNITTEEAQKALEGFKTDSGLLQVFERTNSIIVTDTRQNIMQMAQIAKMIDIATPVMEIVEVIQIKNASATEVQAALQKIVEDAMKYQEKEGKAQQNAQNQRSSIMANRPTGSILRRPGQNQTPTPQESLIASVSDADRGMIRGRVLIVPDERSNKLIIVTNKSNMDFFRKVIAALDVETTPDTLVKVYRLKYADAEEVSDMINDLIGNSSSSQSSSRANQNQNARSGTGANITRGTATTTRKPANQRSGEAKAGELSKDNTTVLADKRINGLVVMTQKELVPTIESIIESMDVKLSQVLIETMIVEVTLGDNLKTGIDWVQRGKQRGQVGTGTYYKERIGTGESQPPGANVFGETHTDDEGNETTVWYRWVENMKNVTLRDGFVNRNNYMLGGGGGSAGSSSLLGSMMNAAGSIGSNVVDGVMWGGANPIGGGVNYLLKSDKLNLAAVLQATKSDSRGKYLASPVVMTVDNKESTIDATDMRYLFKGYQYSGSTLNGEPVRDYEQKEIGIKIKVKPKINPNGTVMLNLNVSYEKVNYGGQIVDGESQDTTTTRKMTADAILDNMQTVVLGGLISTEKANSESGIPILKDIPWIGKWLFGSVSQHEERKELLIFMTPYVLDDAEAAQAEALRRKRSLSDTRPWEDHGWSASELADPVQKKEVLRRLKDEAAKQDEERQTRLAIEKWKLDRAKALEKMDEAERKFWIESHREELEKEEKEKFDAEVKEQADLKLLATQIREQRLEKANEKIDANAADLQSENERGRLEAEKKKSGGDASSVGTKEPVAVEPVAKEGAKSP